MSAFQRSTCCGGVVLAATLVLMAACTSSPPAVKENAAAAASDVKRLPAFRLRDTQGREVSSGEFRGKTLLVNYWATWCKPCETEMPGLQELQTQYADRGLQVVGIAMDMDAQEVAAFGKTLGITYPLLMGTQETQDALGILGIPTTIFVDRDGVIRHTIIGFEYKEPVEKQLLEILPPG